MRNELNKKLDVTNTDKIFRKLKKNGKMGPVEKGDIMLRILFCFCMLYFLFLNREAFTMFMVKLPSIREEENVNLQGH